MNQAFDPLNILILAVAVIVLLRLRSVLGTRTGQEKRYDPFSPSKTTESTSTKNSDSNVVPLPGHEDPDTAEQKPIWTGYANEGSSLAEGFESICAADKSFDPAEFLQGARAAYEMIVTAFSEGDKKSLKGLLSKEVYSGFSTAIDERKSSGETMQTQFVGIDDASFVDATLSDRIASLTIRFVSQLISVTRDKDDNVTDGDPAQINEVTDVWTFERDVTSRDPNWNLAATEANS